MTKVIEEEQKPQSSGRICLGSAAACWVNEELQLLLHRVSPVINTLCYYIDDPPIILSGKGPGWLLSRLRRPEATINACWGGDHVIHRL